MSLPPNFKLGSDIEPLIPVKLDVGEGFKTDATELLLDVFVSPRPIGTSVDKTNKFAERIFRKYNAKRVSLYDEPR